MEKVIEVEEMSIVAQIDPEVGLLMYEVYIWSEALNTEIHITNSLDEADHKAVISLIEESLEQEDEPDVMIEIKGQKVGA